jgi:thiamine-phosphate pyrophosphorylase
MARCYSAPMPKRQPVLPSLWLVSDARNDTVLEAVLRKLPRGSGLVFRHYHLAPQQRRARFAELMALARQCGHIVALSGKAATARRWGADAAYGPPGQLARGPAILRLATAHSLREIATARRARANAILLSPAFPTRSHPGGKVLGPVRFRLLAARALVPVIALGGMNARAARRIGTARWAAVDGLCDEATRSFSKDS